MPARELRPALNAVTGKDATRRFLFTKTPHYTSMSFLVATRGRRAGSSSRPSRVARHESRKRGREAAAADAELAHDIVAERGSDVAAEPAGLNDLLADDSGECDLADKFARQRDLASSVRGREAAATAERGRKVAAVRPPDAVIAARFRAESRPCHLCRLPFLTNFQGSFPLCADCWGITRAVRGTSSDS